MPDAGVPIEIDVYGGNNIATIATLEGAQEPACAVDDSLTMTSRSG